MTIISTVPVLLGAGIPLFKQNQVEEALTLVGVNEYPNGLIQTHYLKG